MHSKTHNILKWNPKRKLQQMFFSRFHFLYINSKLNKKKTHTITAKIVSCSKFNDTPVARAISPSNHYSKANASVELPWHLDKTATYIVRLCATSCWRKVKVGRQQWKDLKNKQITLYCSQPTNGNLAAKQRPLRNEWQPFWQPNQQTNGNASVNSKIVK